VLDPDLEDFKFGSGSAKLLLRGFLFAFSVLVFIISNTPRLIVNLFEFAIHASQDTGTRVDVFLDAAKSYFFYLLIGLISYFLSKNLNTLLLYNTSEARSLDPQKVVFRKP
jgi:hypothetical protein